jgi:hypothetical protein
VGSKEKAYYPSGIHPQRGGTAKKAKNIRSNLSMPK